MAVSITKPLWTIQMHDEVGLNVYTGASKTPLTPPTIGAGLSIGGVRYLVDNVTIAVSPSNSASHDFATVISVRLTFAP